MSRIKKPAIVIAIVLIFLLISGWGVVFASAERFITLSPQKSNYIADDKPKISAQWSALPGVRLSEVKVYLDGRDISDEVKKNDVGFTYVPRRRLAQGKHVVAAKLTYNLMMARRVKSRWTFVIDTKAPPLTVAGGADFLVSPAPTYSVSVQSEPEAEITAELNGRQIAAAAADAEGNYRLNLSGLKEKNKLLLTAADKVGNLRTKLLPIIKDETSPTISGVTPAAGTTLRSQVPKVAVDVSDKETALKSAKLSIDGTTAVEKSGGGSLRLAYLGDLLTDGEHKIKVEATDYAGHVAGKEWTFTLDSRRIVINRREHRLYFFRNGGLAKVYPVAVGMPQYPTPRGRFHITYKIKNPTWIAPKSAWAVNMPKRIPPGPGNPLGTRAIGISAPAIFIHGTYSAYSIGRSASHGCIRMYIRDVEQLYEMVSPGIPVDIIN